jgi:hypothetical protein
LLHIFGDRSIGAGTDVHEQIAVLAYDVGELVDNEFRRFESVVLDVTPRFVADGCVGLPVKRADITELAALEIEHPGMFIHGVIFAIDHANVIAIFERTIVVESGKAGQIRTDGSLANPPIEINDVRVILFDEFRATSEPIVSLSVGDVSEVSIKWSSRPIV